MFKQSRLFTLPLLALAMIGVTSSAYAQKKASLEKGKWRVGNGAKPVDVSGVKKGSFPLPANFSNREK